MRLDSQPKAALGVAWSDHRRRWGAQIGPERRCRTLPAARNPYGDTDRQRPQGHVCPIQYGGLGWRNLVSAFGATRVIAVQRSRARIEFAKRLGGADKVICSEDIDPVEGVLQATGGRGADVVITANSSVETHEQAFRMVRNRGRINFFGGLPKGARPISLESNLVHYKELCITGSHGSVPRQHRLALEMLASGTIPGKEFITHTFPLDEIQTAFKVAEGHSGMKVVIHPHPQ